jgi:hypothetical protein
MFTFVKNYKPMLVVLILSIVLVLLAFALFSVRLLFLKKGEFRGSCASNSPFLQKEGAVCGVCGRKTGEACGKEESLALPPTGKSVG